MTAIGSIIGRGVDASKPSAGTAGRLYYSTDVSGGQLQRDNGSSWDSVEGAAGALTTSSAYLATDVTMTTNGTLYDAVSLSLAAGTWLLIGNLGYEAPATSDACTAVIQTSGGTVISSGVCFLTTVNGNMTVPVSAIVSPGTTTTYKLSGVADDNAAHIKASSVVNGQGNNGTYLLAVKVA